MAFSRKTSTVTHYQRAAQHWVLNNILQPVELHEAAHGFRPQRSIVSNAQPHVAAAVVINLDLQNFFPTLSHKRIKGVFKALGYSESAATIFGLLCTEPDTDVTHEGFVVHPTKTRVMRQSSHQEVTGIVVNHQPGIDKEKLKRLRAVLFQIEKDGPDGKHWNHSRDVLASLRGFANFVYMVDPVKGAAYQRRVGALIEKYDWHPPRVKRKSKAVQPTPAPALETAPPKAERPWWKLW